MWATSCCVCVGVNKGMGDGKELVSISYSGEVDIWSQYF